MLQRLNDDSIELIHGLKEDGRQEELSLIVNSSHDSREVLLSLMQRLLPVAQIDHVRRVQIKSEAGSVILYVSCQALQSCFKRMVSEKRAFVIYFVRFFRHVSGKPKNGLIFHKLLRV